MKNTVKLFAVVLLFSLGYTTKAQFHHDFSLSSTIEDYSSNWYSDDAGCFLRSIKNGADHIYYYDLSVDGVRNAGSSLVVRTPVMSFNGNFDITIEYTFASSSSFTVWTNFAVPPGPSSWTNGDYTYNVPGTNGARSSYTIRSSSLTGSYRPLIQCLQAGVIIHSITITNVVYAPGPGCSVTNGGGCTDSDTDGVCDDADDFPNDPDKAFSAVMPQKNWMYEDLYPNYGDFDFNDLVVSSEREVITDADNILRVLKVKATVSAAGAAISQGWALELKGISPSDVLSVNGNSLTEGVLVMGANGTENGQTNAVIPMFDNFKTISNNNGSQFLNTVKTDAMGTSTPVEVVIEFAKGSELGREDLDFNFFSFRTNDRGHEIHEMGFTPTDLANNALFGTGKDATDLNNGASYVSVDGFPWAISSMGGDYAIEKVDMVQGFLKFAAWAQSGGVSFQDWHTNMSGTYRNAANIY